MSYDTLKGVGIYQGKLLGGRVYVRLGNTHAVEAYRLPGAEALYHRKLDGERVTEIHLADGLSIDEAESTAIASMANHIVAGQKPDWVECSDPDLQERLQRHYGLLGRNSVPGPIGMVGLSLALVIAALLFKWLPMLRTNNGRDWQCRLMGDPSSNATGYFAPATWMGVTANNNNPIATETALPGEITVGTLARAQGSFAHTTGTASYTVTKTFTSDQNVILNKSGLFTASTGGTMVFTSRLNEPAQVVSGDQVQTTTTVTP